MSWDAILAAVQGLGATAATGAEAAAPAAAAATPIAETTATAGAASTAGAGGGFLSEIGNMLGAVNTAGGTAMKAMGRAATDPNGLVGQMGRVAATVGGFAQGGVKGGLGVMEFINKQDQMAAEALSKAAAEGLSPEEAAVRYPGMISPTQEVTSMGPGVNGQPDNRISFPSSPADMEKARVEELKLQRSASDYSPEDMAGSAAQAQRLNLPTDFRQNNAAVEASLPPGGMDQGQDRIGRVYGPEGMKISQQSLDPLDRLYTYDEIKSIEVPDGVKLVTMPGTPAVDDQGNTVPRAALKFVNVGDGRQLSMPEIAERYAMHAYPDDPVKQREMWAQLVHGGASNTPKEGTLGAMLHQASTDLGRPLSLQEQSDLKQKWEAKPNFVDQIKGAKDPNYRAPTKGEEIQAYVDSLREKKGEVAPDGQGTQAPSNPNATSILEEERNKLYEGAFGIQTPGPKATPYNPGANRGANASQAPQATIPEFPQTTQTPTPQRNSRPKAKPKFADVVGSLPEITMQVFESLHNHGPGEAGKDLAEYMKVIEASPKEKASFLRSIVDQFQVSPEIKLQIEKAAIAELGNG